MEAVTLYLGEYGIKPMPKDNLKEKIEEVIWDIIQSDEPMSYADQILSLFRQELNESIPEIVRDLTAVPTQGLEKSRARRILEDKLNEII